MHIIIGVLGSIVTILWLLHRLAEMGIDLAGLNPFLWRRRRRWRAEYSVNPLFRVTEPLDLTALLMTAVAKSDGDMSADEKRGLLGLFEREFELSKREAVALLSASAHLLGRGDELVENLEQVMNPALEKFKPHQVETARRLLHDVATLDGAPSERQASLVNRASSIFQKASEPPKKWD